MWIRNENHEMGFWFAFQNRETGEDSAILDNCHDSSSLFVTAIRAGMKRGGLPIDPPSLRRV
jgi:hypothetical protein